MNIWFLLSVLLSYRCTRTGVCKDGASEWVSVCVCNAYAECAVYVVLCSRWICSQSKVWNQCIIPKNVDNTYRSFSVYNKNVDDN